MKQIQSMEMIAKNPSLLWSNVIKTDKCWLWNKSVNKSGYGSIRVGPTSVLAHRAAFLLSGIPFFTNKCVCHSCDTPRCCNPNHLFQADQAGNMLDMKQKGRRKNIGCGESNGRAKLTQSLANEIRQKRLVGKTLKELAIEYQVGISTISRVTKQEIWK
jgi:hypothetical protein